MRQRPIQTILKRKPAPKVDQPVKPEPKIIKTEPKEVKKQEEEKPTPLPPQIAESRQSGNYELNERMTRMVEAELRDIMIKVWQELPDNPSDEAECLVVDELRNQAGDDLRNVLGLNITKRLLNVYNRLFVKVKFSGKPEKAHLGEFLKKYNFILFKRIEKTVNLFAAQVKTINDFDRICTTKDIRCGNIKVTVYPMYRFTKCPPNLVTSFKESSNETSKTTEPSEKDVKNEKVDVKSDNIKTSEKDNKQTENGAPKPKAEANKTENVAKVEKVNKTVENKTAVAKPAGESKTTVNKPAVENKSTVNKPAVENKSTVSKPAVENKSTVSKPAVENKSTVNKPAVENKSTVNKPAVENKSSVSKPAVENNSTVNKPRVENKATVNKPLTENKEVKKSDVVNSKAKDTPKKAVPSPVKTSLKTKAVPPAKQVKEKVVNKGNKLENDYDELDDYDILALMSEGIVLDECSGSDEE